MPLGRPTDYDDKVLEDAEWYLEHYEDKKIGDAIPTIAGLARYLEVSRETIYEWISQEDKKDFSYTVRELLSEQERELINGSLKGKLNPSVAKLLLASNHGHKERTDVTTEGKALPTPILGGLSTKQDETLEEN